MPLLSWDENTSMFRTSEMFHISERKSDKIRHIIMFIHSRYNLLSETNCYLSDEFIEYLQSVLMQTHKECAKAN